LYRRFPCLCASLHSVVTEHWLKAHLFWA
jgi:hypothetical protein